VRKIIITVAPVGTRPTKAMNPAVPYTPAEIAGAVAESCRAGAAIAHLHVRDPKTGSPEIKPPDLQIELYKEALDLVRKKCNIIVSLSLSKVGLSGPNLIEQRLRPVRLRPDFVSIHAEPEFMEASGELLREYCVKAEMEAFTVDDIKQGLHFIKNGYFDEPVPFNLCMGTPRGVDAAPGTLLKMKEQLPDEAIWSAMVMDPSQQFRVIAMALVLGGNLRVGFEDSIFVRQGVLAKNNAQLVERAVNLAHFLDYEVASPDEAREMLGLRKQN
jgi:3-keto-5-aminohexanoate cleavage enzyme